MDDRQTLFRHDRLWTVALKPFRTGGPPTAHPLEWANINFNLGLALGTGFERSSTNPDIDLLIEAENCFDNALQVFTQANDPISWAAAQKGLANILRRKASQTTKTRERIR